MVNLIYLCFIVSVVLSIWHLAEEWKGQLWRYFGAKAGVRISDAVGCLVFTVGLGFFLLLAAASLLLIDGKSSVLGVFGAGFLFGGRVSDWWNSHYHLYFEGYNNWPLGFRGGGNPGLLSSWFYLADSALLIYLLAAVRVVVPSWWGIDWCGSLPCCHPLHPAGRKNAISQLPKTASMGCEKHAASALGTQIGQVGPAVPRAPSARVVDITVKS